LQIYFSSRPIAAALIANVNDDDDDVSDNDDGNHDSDDDDDDDVNQRARVSRQQFLVSFLYLKVSVSVRFCLFTFDFALHLNKA
jgi:hypothetical protein